jgi:hypothetical protein
MSINEIPPPAPRAAWKRLADLLWVGRLPVAAIVLNPYGAADQIQASGRPDETYDASSLQERDWIMSVLGGEFLGHPVVIIGPQSWEDVVRTLPDERRHYLNPHSSPERFMGVPVIRQQAAEKQLLAAAPVLFSGVEFGPDWRWEAVSGAGDGVAYVIPSSPWHPRQGRAKLRPALVGGHRLMVGIAPEIRTVFYRLVREEEGMSRR